VAVVLSLVSALLLAVGSTLQHAAAHDGAKGSGAPGKRAVGPVLRIVWNPTWLIGSVIDLGAYGVEIAALSRGRLTVVEPLLALGLVFALPMSARRAGRALHLSSVVAALAVSGGVTVFVLTMHPVPTRAATPDRWPAVIAVFALLIVAAWYLAVRSPRSSSRAAGLAVAAGLTYGLTAALTKALVDRSHQSWWQALSSWTVPVLLLASLAGLLLGQAAFRAGPLSSSMPTLTVIQRIVGAGLGLELFGERFPLHRTELIATVVAGALASIGIVWLQRMSSVPFCSFAPEHGKGPTVGLLGDQREPSMVPTFER